MKNNLYINAKLTNILNNNKLIENLKSLKREESYASLDIENALENFPELNINIDDMYNIYIDSVLDIESVEKKYINIEQ